MGINGGTGIVSSGSVLGGSGISLPKGGGGGGFDPDAQAAITAIGADATIGGYLNQLFLDLKGQGNTTNGTDVYSKCPAIYPMSPSDISTISDATCKWNVKDPRDLDAAFRLDFINTPLFSVANGLEQNGTVIAYAKTFFNASTELSAGNNGITISISNAVATAPVSYLSGTSWFSVRKSYSGSPNGFKANVRSEGVGLQFGGEIITEAIYSFSRRTSTDLEIYKNGNSFATSSTPTSQPLDNLESFILALNFAGSPSGYARSSLDFVVFHEGLTDAESQDLSDAISNWRTNLGR